MAIEEFKSFEEYLVTAKESIISEKEAEEEAAQKEAKRKAELKERIDRSRDETELRQSTVLRRSQRASTAMWGAVGRIVDALTQKGVEPELVYDPRLLPKDAYRYEDEPTELNVPLRPFLKSRAEKLADLKARWALRKEEIVKQAKVKAWHTDQWVHEVYKGAMEPLRDSQAELEWPSQFWPGDRLYLSIGQNEDLYLGLNSIRMREWQETNAAFGMHDHLAVVSNGSVLPATFDDIRVFDTPSPVRRLNVEDVTTALARFAVVAELPLGIQTPACS